MGKTETRSNLQVSGPFLEKRYIDLHSHMLPKMDDGSASTEESLAMIEASLAQGVYCIALTPHFYADRDLPENFLKRRRASLEQLRAQLRGIYPILLPGAEVHYFRDMAKVDALLDFRIHKTRLLLVEMPFCKWTPVMLDDVMTLNARPEIQVVLAHIERYLQDQPKGTLEELVLNGFMIQTNATYFLDFFQRRKALRYLQEGLIHFIGSDSHNMRSRPPRIGDAYQVICDSLGVQEAERQAKRQLRLLLSEEIKKPK